MEPISIITSNALRFHSIPSSSNCNHLFSQGKSFNFLTQLHKRFGVAVKSLASQNYGKKSSRKDGEVRRSRNQKSSRIPADEYMAVADKSSSRDDLIAESNGVLLNDGLAGKSSISSASRSAVLQACTITSGLILALGFLIRQVSHIAFTEGLPVLDCSAEVSVKFEIWHLELISGLVILISSCRYLLLQTWPDFAESSEAANRQILSSLQPLDYTVVAILPGFSEEFLFRGALLPLFGLNWKSALAVAVIFGALHVGSGRRYSFAIWATFVGLAYGYATILSSSVIVPATSHALNNLIGGIMWLYTSNDKEGE